MKKKQKNIQVLNYKINLHFGLENCLAPKNNIDTFKR